MSLILSLVNYANYNCCNSFEGFSHSSRKAPSFDRAGGGNAWRDTFRLEPSIITLAISQLKEDIPYLWSEQANTRPIYKYWTPLSILATAKVSFDFSNEFM